MHASGQTARPALQSLLEDRALTGDWVLDPQRSTIRLKNKVLGGLLSVNGVFGEVSGHGSVSSGGEASGTITAAVASIDTKNTKRDTHLRSAEIFDAVNHPYVTFTVTGVRPSGQGVAVTGTLTARDRTRPLSFDAAVSVPGNEEVWLDAVARTNRADFGLRWKGDGIASMTTTLTIHAVFTRR
jgi:polyisoprenoid-binding protein YceI